MNAKELKYIKNHANEWYESYVSVHHEKNVEVIITPSFAYNPLFNQLKIHNTRKTFDIYTQYVAKKLQSIGIKTTISGPIGLGAAAELSASSIISVLRSFLRLTAYVISKYQKSIIEKAKPGINIRLEMYVDEDANIIIQAQQFVLLVSALINDTSKPLNGIKITYLCSISALLSDRTYSFSSKSGSDFETFKNLRNTNKLHKVNI